MSNTHPLVKNGRGTCNYFICEWPNSQLDHPMVAGLSRLVVNYSVASYVIWHDRKSAASHSWIFSHPNFCRARPVTRGGRAPVAGQSLIGRKALQVSQRSVASVSQRSGRGCDSGTEFMSIDLRMACEGRELASLSWCDRKSLLLLGQLYTFCFLVCQSLPNIDVDVSLRSNDINSTTAHESKKSRIFQLVNRS